MEKLKLELTVYLEVPEDIADGFDVSRAWEAFAGADHATQDEITEMGVEVDYDWELEHHDKWCLYTEGTIFIGERC